MFLYFECFTINRGTYLLKHAHAYVPVVVKQPVFYLHVQGTKRSKSKDSSIFKTWAWIQSLSVWWLKDKNKLKCQQTFSERLHDYFASPRMCVLVFVCACPMGHYITFLPWVIGSSKRGDPGILSYQETMEHHRLLSHWPIIWMYTTRLNSQLYCFFFFGSGFLKERLLYFLNKLFVK